MNYLHRLGTNQEQIHNGIRHVLFGWVPRPRNGKVAKLPQTIREQINQMIDDGLPYRSIINHLRQANPPLPYPISEMNLSTWRKGGYREWRAKQLQEKARALVAQAQEPTGPTGTPTNSELETRNSELGNHEPIASQQRPTEVYNA